MAHIAHPAVVIRRVVDALLVVLVSTCLVAIVLARGVPLTGRSTFVVGGGSMEPAIALGSAVVVEPVAPTSLAVGDVVSLRSGPDRAIFTHRIIRIAQGDGGIWVETQGDANAAPDPSMTPATAIIGRVTIAIPGIGYLVTVVSTPAGALFFIALGLLLLTAARTAESYEPGPRVRPLAVLGGPAPLTLADLRRRRILRTIVLTDRPSRPGSGG
jgi:signal peptidase I